MSNHLLSITFQEKKTPQKIFPTFSSFQVIFLHTCMRPDVPLQQPRSRKRFTAVRTLTVLIVCPHMHRKCRHGNVNFITNWTTSGFLVLQWSMGLTVSGEIWTWKSGNFTWCFILAFFVTHLLNIFYRTRDRYDPTSTTRQVFHRNFRSNFEILSVHFQFHFCHFHFHHPWSFARSSCYYHMMHLWFRHNFGHSRSEIRTRFQSKIVWTIAASSDRRLCANNSRGF